MIDRDYRLNKPEGVRELIRLGSIDVNTTLALVYAHNKKVSEAHYLQRRARTRGVVLWEQESLSRCIDEKHRLRAKIRQVLDVHRMRIMYGTGGRIESLIFKVTRRGRPRPTGGIYFVTQEALFPFSDMYSEERFGEWLVNRVITGETR